MVYILLITLTSVLLSSHGTLNDKIINVKTKMYVIYLMNSEIIYLSHVYMYLECTDSQTHNAN